MSTNLIAPAFLGQPVGRSDRVPRNNIDRVAPGDYVSEKSRRQGAAPMAKDSLKDYQEKRDFGITPEPPGGRGRRPRRPSSSFRNTPPAGCTTTFAWKWTGS